MSSNHETFWSHFSRTALRLDDTVVIQNCRPLSARKRFTLEQIVKSPETERDEMHRRKAEAQAQALLQTESGVPSTSEATVSS